MVYLNRVELQGRVGTVRAQEISGKNVINLSLATEVVADHDSHKVVETTWHHVVVWEGEKCKDVTGVQKGDVVYVMGRLRQSHYTDSSGNDKVFTEVLANRFEIIESI